MAKIVELKNSDFRSLVPGEAVEKVYPVTRAQCVFDRNGMNLEERFRQLESGLSLEMPQVLYDVTVMRPDLGRNPMDVSQAAALVPEDIRDKVAYLSFFVLLGTRPVRVVYKRKDISSDISLFTEASFWFPLDGIGFADLGSEKTYDISEMRNGGIIRKRIDPSDEEKGYGLFVFDGMRGQNPNSSLSSLRLCSYEELASAIDSLNKSIQELKGAIPTDESIRSLALMEAKSYVGDYISTDMAGYGGDGYFDVRYAEGAQKVDLDSVYMNNSEVFNDHCLGALLYPVTLGGKTLYVDLYESYGDIIGEHTGYYSDPEALEALISELESLGLDREVLDSPSYNVSTGGWACFVYPLKKGSRYVLEGALVDNRVFSDADAEEQASVAAGILDRLGFQKDTADGYTDKYMYDSGDMGKIMEEDFFTLRPDYRLGFYIMDSAGYINVDPLMTYLKKIYFTNTLANMFSDHGDGESPRSRFLEDMEQEKYFGGTGHFRRLDYTCGNEGEKLVFCGAFGYRKVLSLSGGKVQTVMIKERTCNLYDCSEPLLCGSNSEALITLKEDDETVIEPKMKTETYDTSKTLKVLDRMDPKSFYMTEVSRYNMASDSSKQWPLGFVSSLADRMKALEQVVATQHSDAGVVVGSDGSGYGIIQR